VAKEINDSTGHSLDSVAYQMSFPIYHKRLTLTFGVRITHLERKAAENKLSAKLVNKYRTLQYVRVIKKHALIKPMRRANPPLPILDHFRVFWGICFLRLILFRFMTDSGAKRAKCAKSPC